MEASISEVVDIGVYANYYTRFLGGARILLIPIKKTIDYAVETLFYLNNSAIKRCIE